MGPFKTRKKKNIPPKQLLRYLARIWCQCVNVCIIYNSPAQSTILHSSLYTCTQNTHTPVGSWEGETYVKIFMGYFFFFLFLHICTLTVKVTSVSSPRQWWLWPVVVNCCLCFRHVVSCCHHLLLECSISVSKVCSGSSPFRCLLYRYSSPYMLIIRISGRRKRTWPNLSFMLG